MHGGRGCGAVWRGCDQVAAGDSQVIWRGQAGYEWDEWWEA